MKEAKLEALNLAIAANAPPELLVRTAQSIMNFLEEGELHRPENSVAELPASKRNKS